MKRLGHLYVEPSGGRWVVLDNKHATLAVCDTKEQARAWVLRHFAQAAAPPPNQSHPA